MHATSLNIFPLPTNLLMRVIYSGVILPTGALLLGTMGMPADGVHSPSHFSTPSSSIMQAGLSKWPANGAPAMIGVNMSGAEFSYDTYPTVNDLDYVQSKGLSLIRLPISWEKTQSTLNGPLNQAE